MNSIDISNSAITQSLFKIYKKAGKNRINEEKISINYGYDPSSKYIL
jgi:hypothetical protein